MSDNVHWADHVALHLIQSHPHKNEVVCASGISPSGTVHIGNFREVITVDFVVRALKERDKKVRFIYSWDDYDALRKVPANLPQPKLIEANLRMPLAKASDPFETDPSYAAHFERAFEQSLAQLEINPEFIRQHIPYENGNYAEGIRTALEQQPKIVEILNRSRTEDLPPDWTCISIFCKQCTKDNTKLLQYTSPYSVKYFCKGCKKEFTVNFNEPKSGVKLLWRVDWPMRWAKEEVDFEPGGKDHSSQGGSYDTGAQIIREVWKKEPPHYVQYDFVLAKGMGAKLSSSSGNLITLDEALEIYEPSVLRWIFASRKPNIDFSIAFDLDVIKAYDDFDRTTRIALGTEEADEKKVRYERRIYELSRVNPYPDSNEKLAVFNQFPFRHLCNILQIHRGDIEKAKTYFSESFKQPHSEDRFEIRAKRAWNWITKFAPEQFRFSLQDTPKHKVQDSHRSAAEALISLLDKYGLETNTDQLQLEEALHKDIFSLIKSCGLEPKLFFKEIYSVLISKESGPKLASFLLTMGPKKAAEILKKSLTNIV